MENQVPPNSGQSSEEIDLGQLFQLIGQGLNKLFLAFLKLFVYLKKNIIKLGILAVVGLAIGIGLNQIVTKQQKIEVIVRPNLESKNYLYDVVNEIQANVISRDSLFFNQLGINTEELKGFRIEIEPTVQIDREDSSTEELKYLELLEKFRSDDLLSDVLRNEILNKSSLNLRLTFFFKTGQDGVQIAKKIINYINSNDYFNELVRIRQENAEKRITENQSLVQQIDNLVANYADKMTKSSVSEAGRVIVDNEEQLDVTGLLGLKNSLIRDTERKKLELQIQKEGVRVINFGASQEVQKSFFGKNVVLIPLILIVIFFLISFIKYLNAKSRESQLN